MEFLSNEIKLEILGNLSAQDINNIRLLSKEWNQLATDNFLWQRLFFRDFPEPTNIPNSSWYHGYVDEYRYMNSPPSEVTVYSSASIGVLNENQLLTLIGRIASEISILSSLDVTYRTYSYSLDLDEAYILFDVVNADKPWSHYDRLLAPFSMTVSFMFHTFHLHRAITTDTVYDRYAWMTHDSLRSKKNDV
jgi:hypothetical protein